MYSYYLGFLALCLATTVTGFDRSIGLRRPWDILTHRASFPMTNPMSELVKFREAELKHGRWGMVAAVAIPASEFVTHKPAIYALHDPVTFASFVSAVAVAESRSLLLGWKNPFTNSSNLFVMNEDYQPGDLGLPSLYVNKRNRFLGNAELNNGRLGMIAALGMITQELLFD